MNVEHDGTTPEECPKRAINYIKIVNNNENGRCDIPSDINEILEELNITEFAEFRKIIYRVRCFNLCLKQNCYLTT